MPKPDIARSPRIRLSWRAYYERFKEVHGQPVLYREKLLFPDGWTYSTDSYAGPEYPPPKDHERLVKLGEVYWRTKLKVLKALRLETRQRLDGLRSVQSTKAIPLRHLQPKYDEEGKMAGTETVELDLPALGARVDQIDLDIQDCEAKIEELKDVSRPIRSET